MYRTRPRKARTCLVLVGRGQSQIIDDLAGSALIPNRVMTWPRKKLTSVRKNCVFFAEQKSLASLSAYMTKLMFRRCSSMVRTK